MKATTLLTTLLACYLGVTLVNSLAVMSVDLGSEWMKVGIVSPGVPMEIALNKESKRKTPTLISFRDNARLFGEDAQTVGVRFPKQAFGYLLDLLGKNISHPLVKLYQKRFPYYDIVEDSERGVIQFRLDDETSFTPEELVAQLLAKAKEFAENSAHQPIKECVLTVPGFFNQAERKAMIQAGELAGLKVLQLINDYTAVALNYGIFRAKSFNETSQYVIFYDMGASSTTAVLVSYQTIKTKERGYVETHPQLTILGVGYDRTLGGLDIQLRLRDYLGRKFNEMKKTKNDVFENPRALAKLFKEAGRLKNVLSANNEHYAQVEGLLDEQDFRVLVTRDDLEGLCEDLFERVSKPIEQALKTAHLTMDVVSQVVLVGAGTRVPKVQEYLQKAVKRELAKNLNTDEAAALGAVYKAADLSTGFKVSKFITKDAVVFPIQVTFERATEDGVKTVKRMLFGLMNPYPQKKIITFNKHTHDFSFMVNYAELEHLSDEEVKSIGDVNLSEYKLSGVEEAIRKNLGENVESKGIKAHFNMDDSGVLNLLNVEYVVEKTVLPVEEEEGTLSKLGNTFSKLFGSEKEKPANETPEEEKPAEEKPTEEKEAEEKQTEDNKDPKQPKNDTVKTNATEKEPKEAKPKVVTVKEPIASEEIVLTGNRLSKQQLSASMEKLHKLDKIERDINRRATALNNLESFVIDIQNKLLEDEYVEASTPDELEKIKTACGEISDWLYDDGSEADAETYEKKTDELHQLTKDLFVRVWEHKERPEALKALHTVLNNSAHFLDSAKNLTSEKDIFTEVEIETLQKLIADTTEWRDKMVKEQEESPKSAPIKLTVKLLMDKMGALDREVKYLLNKVKMWKPKKTEKPSTNTTSRNETTTEEEGKVVPAEETAEEENIIPELTEEEATIEIPDKQDEENAPEKKEKKIKPSSTKPNQDDAHTEL